MNSKHVFLSLVALSLLICNAPIASAQSQASSQASSESGGVPFTMDSAPALEPAKKEVTTTTKHVAKKSVTKAAVKPKVVNYRWKTRTSTTTNHRKY